MKQYTIKPFPNVSESFTLIVTPNVKKLRFEIEKAFEKWDRDEPEANLDGCAGMFSPACTFEKGPYDGTFTSDVFGTMFLAEDHLGVGYVAHECLHAAMAHERQRIRFDMNYGNDCDDHEERLAYYLTYCVREVWNTLIENGHVKEYPK